MIWAGRRVLTKIFELDQDLGEYLCHSIHELIHELIHLCIAHALLTTTEVEGIFKIFGVVGTELKREGEEEYWLLRLYVVSCCEVDVDYSHLSRWGE
jgi:hypothetical protein